MQTGNPLLEILEKLNVGRNGAEKERLIDNIIRLDEACPAHIKHAGFGYPGSPPPIIVQAPSENE